MRIRILLPLLALLASCATHNRPATPGGMEYAQWFDLQGNKAIVTSPYGGAPDTIQVDAPVRSIVCMSSSYIGFLDALGCDSVATAVSGLAYVSDPDVRAHAVDVGYDAALDYETILSGTWASGRPSSTSTWRAIHWPGPSISSSSAS